MEFVLVTDDGQFAEGEHGVFRYSSRDIARIAARVLGKQHGRYYKVVKA